MLFGHTQHLVPSFPRHSGGSISGQGLFAHFAGLELSALVCCLYAVGTALFQAGTPELAPY